MSIRYSGGTIIHRTFTPANRQAILDNVTQALADAGWTTISGTPGSGTDVVQESLAQNAGAKIRLRSTLGASISAAFAVRALTGSTDGTFAYLNPANTYRIIANKFFIHCFQTTTANRQAVRSWLHAGTLYTPSFLGVANTDAFGFCTGGGTSDGDGSGRAGWRTSCKPYGQSTVTSLIISNAMYNTTLASQSGVFLLNWQGGYQNVDQAWRWEDGSLPVIEPLVAGAIPTDSEQKIFGQLYDAIVVGGNTLGGETTFSLDGHTWLVVTDSPQVNVASTAQLAVAIT